MNNGLSISLGCIFLTIFLIVGYGCVSKDTDVNDFTHTLIKNASVPGCYKEKYSDPTISEYILPYGIGQTFKISQGNCGKFSTHRPRCKAMTSSGVTVDCGDLRYSYDFAIPIGQKIYAARGGAVTAIEDKYSNLSVGSGEENYIVIEHNDGTIAIYLHLSPKGVLVKVGEYVTQGDVIGIAGNSGFTGGLPHLHFHVLRPPYDKCNAKDITGCKTIPIVFKNANPLDSPLIESIKYKAEDID